MDRTMEQLSTYACGLTYEDLPTEVVHQVKRTLIDTLGCAMGAFEDKTFTQRFPQEYNSRMEVTTVSGQRFTAQTAYPKGHRHNPFSDTDIEAKSRRLAGEVLTEQKCRTVLELLWSLERLPDLPALFDALDAGDPPPNWVLRTAIGPASMAG